MDKIIKFYELNEKDLINYDKEAINKLYKIIIDTKKKLENNNWIDKCLSTIEECNEIFSSMNKEYIQYIDEYIIKLKECSLDNFHKLNLDNTKRYIVRKINLYIQLLEYISAINSDEKIYFDMNKYGIIIETYNIFFNLKEDINKCYVEWYSNNYLFYYSESKNNTNICIYYLDDLFGYRIFLTYKKNNITNEIKLCVFDTIIKSEKDFYKKIERSNKMKFINIKQIAKCFSINSNIEKCYSESNFIDENKMLQYVNIFMNQ